MQPDEEGKRIRSERVPSKEASVSLELECTIFQIRVLVNFLYTFFYLTVYEFSEPDSLGVVASSLHGHD